MSVLSGGQFEPHEAHGPHPSLSGWREQPCGFVGCEHFDEGFLDRTLASDDHPVARVTTVEPHDRRLRVMEHYIDHDTVTRYAKNPPSGPVHAYEDPEGSLHINDGHHRLLAAAKAGRKVAIEVRK